MPHSQGRSAHKPGSELLSDIETHTPPGPKAAPTAEAGAPDRVSAVSLIDENAAWLPADPDRKAAFLQVYRYWHAQLTADAAPLAKPAFLFLVTALPVMVEAREELKEMALWEPAGEQSRWSREQHPAWRKWCDLMPRAQQAMQDLDDYRRMSLATQLDEMLDKVTKAEKRFRGAR